MFLVVRIQSIVIEALSHLTCEWVGEKGKSNRCMQELTGFKSDHLKPFKKNHLDPVQNMTTYRKQAFFGKTSLTSKFTVQYYKKFSFPFMCLTQKINSNKLSLKKRNSSQMVKIIALNSFTKWEKSADCYLMGPNSVQIVMDPKSN